MLGAIAHGSTLLRNFSTGLDCASTVKCIRALGAQIETADDEMTITSPDAWRAPSAPLDCGNSGSTMRMLAGLLVGQNIACEMVGDDSLSRRPMKRIIEPLQRMGANISSPDGRPPLRIARADGRLHGISYETPIASAQVKTSLLFAGLFAEGITAVSEDIRTRDHGELALRSFGAKVDRTKNTVSIEGGQKLSGIQAYVPGDISSAAFFICLAAMFPQSNLVLDGVGMNPTRSAILDVLSGFGARVSVVNLEEQHGELIGTLRVQGGQLRGGRISGAMSARLIDELPLLAAIAPFTTEGIEIRDAQELRVKESDRIACTAENLRRMGAEVSELEDGLRVSGNQQLRGSELDTFGDHRIGMAFAVAAARATGDSLIRDAEAVAVSFPEFWDFLDRVTS